MAFLMLRADIFKMQCQNGIVNTEGGSIFNRGWHGIVNAEGRSNKNGVVEWYFVLTLPLILNTF